MSGHSKWSTIKRKKGASDVARGKLFSKLSRLITLAVTEGGGAVDPAANVKLRFAVDRARAENMPKDNIERAIKKASGEGREALRAALYEAFGPGGAALLISAATENPNRTLSEIRNTLERAGGKMGREGSVGYLFKKCGAVAFDKDKNSEEAVLEFASCIDAIDVDEREESFVVYFPYEKLGHAKECMESVVPSAAADVDYKPEVVVAVTSPQIARSLLSLIDSVEALDDVIAVYGNFDIEHDLLPT